MRPIRIRRGTKANLPDGGTMEGELRYCTDTHQLYIDDNTENILVSTTYLPNYLELTEVTTPDTPTADSIRIFAEEDDGFTVLSAVDDTGMVRKLIRDSVFIARATVDITIGQAVYADGATGVRPTVSPAKSDSSTTMPSIGIACEDIAAGGYGRIMQVGLLEHIDTSAFSAGDVLYVSATTAGDLTATAPLYPNIRQEVGTVLVDGVGNGKIQCIARSMFNEGILDHGGLLGLTDNDHPQYLLAASKATGEEVDTGTDDDKFSTAKALKDSHNVPSVAPSTAGNVLTSDGTDWTSVAPSLKATGAEIDTGTDDAKFATSKALKDSHNVPSVAPSTSGNVLTSDGTDWTSAAPSLQLVENAPIFFDEALSDDGKYSGMCLAGTAGATLVFGNICYFKAADSQWYLAKGDATATSGAVKLGFCVLAANDNDPTRMLLFGNIRADSLFDTFTISAPVFVSAATAGKIVSAAPTGTTDFVVRIVGHAITGDEVFVNIDPTYVELV